MNNRILENSNGSLDNTNKRTEKQIQCHVRHWFECQKDRNRDWKTTTTTKWVTVTPKWQKL